MLPSGNKTNSRELTNTDEPKINCCPVDLSINASSCTKNIQYLQWNVYTMGV